MLDWFPLALRSYRAREVTAKPIRAAPRKARACQRVGPLTVALGERPY
jgi:hypothetical protein